MTELPIPARPVIRPAEQYVSEPYPILDGVSPTVGWQWLPDRKGGPVFAVLTRTMLGSYKIVERFHLTSEGWTGAWQALVRLSPSNAAKVEQALEKRRAELGDGQRLRPGDETAELDAVALASVGGVTLLGGYAPDAVLKIGERYDLRFLDDRLVIYTDGRPEALLEISYADAEVVEVGGPGLVRSGGGFSGGGFGAVGALEGMAIAAVLNALTTRTTVTTIIRLQATDSELFLMHTTRTPDQVRMDLSRALGAIRAARVNVPAAPASPVEELAKLASMLEGGLLTREEFDAIKSQVISRLE